MLFNWRKKASDKATAPRTFEGYVSAAPSLQNAVDVVSGWDTAFPPEYQLRSGHLTTYDDPRIKWAITCFGSLEGRHVLELGPFEGAHTAMLEAAGARIDAVEADQLTFLRCLVAKEVLRLTRATFWLGDFVKTLESWDRSYDLIVAAGVLERLKEPRRLIELAAQRTDALFICGGALDGDSLIAMLKQVGFQNVKTNYDEGNRLFESTLSIFARK